jgi:chromosomal replication initiator protein
VLYYTGEQFTNAFITAVRNKTLDRFRKQMRELDLLALDDVQFLSDKQGTQTEFLHCFDAIAQSGATILLASDEHPRRLQRFSAPLVSRFGHGLVIQIDPPDTTTRLKLLETFASRRGLILSAPAIEALLPHAGPSVREVLGMLAKLQALAWYEQERNGSPAVAGVGLPVGLALAQRLLEAERSQQPQRTATFDDILKTVTSALEVEPEQVASGSRKRQAVLARELVVRLSREIRKMSYPEIALAMGRHGHSTVLNADKRFDEKLTQELPCPVPGCDNARTVREVHQQLHQRLTFGA